MSETVKFGYGEMGLAYEYVRDESGDEPLLDAPGDVLRIPNGRGWRIWTDTAGAPCVTAFSASECDSLERNGNDAACLAVHEEERLREIARQARDLGPASIRAPR